MSFIANKDFSRFIVIATSGLFRIVGSFSNVIISLFIIRLTSSSLWGEVVYYLLFLDLGFVVINWGHSPYLVREFSRRPAEIFSVFFNSLISRSLILSIFILIVVITQPRGISLVLILFCVGRFVYQAFDPLLQFEKKFLYSFFLEVLGIAIIVIPVSLNWISATSIQILILFAGSFIVRALLRIISQWKLLFEKRPYLSIANSKGYLYQSLPFLLLALSAMLQQRADLYFVAWFLTPDETARYQVFLNLLLFNQLAASLLLSPFSKNVFRLSYHSLRKLEKKIIRAGLILTVVSIFFIYLLIKYLYEFDLPWSMYLMGYFYVLLYYSYLTRNYELGKSYKQKTAAMYSFIGCVINILGSFFLTPKLGLEGAILAGLVTQTSVAFLYYKESIFNYANATR